MNETLMRLGWDAERHQELEELSPGSEPGRVAVRHTRSCIVMTATGDVSLPIPNKILSAEPPAVGDWVAFVRDPDSAMRLVFPRRSALTRKVAGDVTREQMIATNVDVVMIVASLAEPLNLRRLERHLTATWNSGALPHIILNKSDAAPDFEARLDEVQQIAPGAEVFAVSAANGAGIDELAGRLSGGLTAVLLGPSGVGKSTIMNALLGNERQPTAETRKDGKGRHTTTHRELIPLPGGGCLIDTPGIRELQLWGEAEDVEESFTDIATLADGCRFSDCTHNHEPGCAVLAAVADGTLSAERLASYRKQLRELAALARRKDGRLAAEEKKKWKALSQEARAKARIR